MKADLEAGMDAQGGRQSLTTWMEYYLNTVRRVGDKKPKTQEDYQYLCEDLILPDLGTHRIVTITREQLERWRDALLTHYAGHTVKRACALLCAALHDAYERGYLKRNPAYKLAGFETETAPPRPLTVEETRALLAVCDHYASGIAVRLALTLGYRIGETCGARWEDWNEVRQTICVAQQVQETRGAIDTDEPKRGSRRTLPVPPRLAAAIARQRDMVDSEARRRGWADHDLVCPAELGNPMQPSNVRRAFKAMLRRAGLPPIRFHDLRHTCGARLVDAGAPESVIGAVLGHKGGNVTRRYSHAAVEALRPWLDAVERLMYEDGERGGQHAAV